MKPCIPTSVPSVLFLWYNTHIRHFNDVPRIHSLWATGRHHPIQQYLNVVIDAAVPTRVPSMLLLWCNTHIRHLNDVPRIHSLRATRRHHPIQQSLNVVVEVVGRVTHSKGVHLGSERAQMGTKGEPCCCAPTENG